VGNLNFLSLHLGWEAKIDINGEKSLKGGKTFKKRTRTQTKKAIISVWNSRYNINSSTE